MKSWLHEVIERCKAISKNSPRPMREGRLKHIPLEAQGKGHGRHQA